jgi:hypothetical protein
MYNYLTVFETNLQPSTVRSHNSAVLILSVSHVFSHSTGWRDTNWPSRYKLTLCYVDGLPSDSPQVAAPQTEIVLETSRKRQKIAIPVGDGVVGNFISGEGMVPVNGVAGGTDMGLVDFGKRTGIWVVS